MKERLRTIIIVLAALVLSTAAYPANRLVTTGNPDFPGWWGGTTDPADMPAPTKAEVGRFVEAVLGTSTPAVRIGDFRWITTDRSGRRGLLATIDYSGRDFYNTIVLIVKKKRRYEAIQRSVLSMASLAKAAEDLDGDGIPELILPEAITPYLGASPVPRWNAIVSVKGDRLLDRSDEFGWYYRERILPELEARLLEASSDGGDGLLKDAIIVTQSKVLRYLGDDVYAGLDDGLRMAVSPDWKRRVYAASLLKDIPDPRASAAVKRLVADDDGAVSAFAASGSE